MNLLWLGGGLWIIPLLTFAGSIIFLYQSYKASKSNSTTQVKAGDGSYYTKDNTGNVPIYKIGRFYFAVALFVATVVILLAMYSDK